MKTPRNLVIGMTLAAAGAGALLAENPRAEDHPAGSPATPAASPRVELAICLDTSGSMQGLIDAARQKLWEIVNDLATARPTPDLRVALLTFGNDGHAAENGWVRVDADFTPDLDVISQQLFALTTNGGTELVGRVLDASARLAWTPGTDALKLVIVAGNESADQDQEIPFRDVCPRLIADGVLVNAIYCGPEADDIAPGWRDVARLADGQFASIDQDQGTIVVETPFDAKLTELSTAINGTFCWFGDAGVAACANQVAQDQNAGSLNLAAAATRAQTKANGLYWNRNDLVHAIGTGATKLEDVKPEDLPEEMREMSLEERKAHLEKQAAERARIEAEINELAKKRDAFVAAEMTRRAADAQSGFDTAVRAAIREQARAKGLRWPEPEVVPAAAGGEADDADANDGDDTNDAAAGG